MTETQNFDAALTTFVKGCQEITDIYFRTNFPNLAAPTFKTQPGRRYVRVVRVDGGNGGGSAHCFVDMTNGDVLKPAGYKTPARHARGNIFDEHNGLSRMGPHGPAYLR